MITIDLHQDVAPAERRLSLQRIRRMTDRINAVVGRERDGIISVAFVSDGEIQRLNRMYREKDRVTDVLSFSYIDDAWPTEQLGDVVISFPQAERQAEDGDIELELVDLIVHGVLHVLGYDHEQPADAKEMFAKQDEIVTKSV